MRWQTDRKEDPLRMARSRSAKANDSAIPAGLKRFIANRFMELLGLGMLAVTIGIALSLASWQADDPSLNYAIDREPENLLGYPGAVVADLLMQFLGLGVIGLILPLLAWSTRWLGHGEIGKPIKRSITIVIGSVLLAAFMSVITAPTAWPLPTGLGGAAGDLLARPMLAVFTIFAGETIAAIVTGVLFLFAAIIMLLFACAFTASELVMSAQLFGSQFAETVSRVIGGAAHAVLSVSSFVRRVIGSPSDHVIRETVSDPEVDDEIPPPADNPPRSRLRQALNALVDFDDDPVEAVAGERIEPSLSGRGEPRLEIDEMPEPEDLDPFPEEFDAPPQPTRITRSRDHVRPAKGGSNGRAPAKGRNFALPPLSLLSKPPRPTAGAELSDEVLEENARLLEGVLDDFSVRGEIINVRPGPVVTLYELEPAPGIKSSRVIGLADDIARSMSAISARVAVVPGRNVIGIELPNETRETVFLREMLSSADFIESGQDLTLALGKNIGGGPIISDLARMPHLLIAGTTGSGKSVGINTMILSLLFRLPPDKCKLILIDPKMLELSVYDGIPHLLAPVVTDPKKAVVSLKWAVREMEDRYRKMSKLGVRNIHGFNQRVTQAMERDEVLTRTVHTGYDAASGEPIYEEEEIQLEEMPFIVIIIDEMADLMMVAGKDIEGAVQRLAQMARAAGIHIVTATQRPSVDVITGTIKANFPTRISFQVTSKIDSRTILGEQGAEQLLGQGDMLYMAGGGRISRIHGPFVSDEEVEKIVRHLKKQGAPQYVEAVTEEGDDDEFSIDGMDGAESSGDELFDKAVAIVVRDKKASTSYIQRRLSIGYNRAATLIERMEQDGIISPANHAGKRDILVGGGGEDEFH